MQRGRQCQIVSANVEMENGAGDGAYDLLDVVGTPEEIAKAVADSLKEIDLVSGRGRSVLDAGHDLYLTVRIKICESGAAHS